MATFQHPGVYIEEFTPASPIEGVGTSTAAFIGVANQGPIMTPTQITSWDAFKATFGDYVDETFTGGDKPYLALAVKGFFLNGGTTCYVVRSSSATNATANLATRNAPNDATIVVNALAEGSGANGITVTVADRSVVQDALGADLNVAQPSTSISAMPNRRTLTVADNTGFQVDDVVTVEKTGLADLQAEIDGLSGTTGITLKLPLPGGDDYSAGTIRMHDLDSTTTTIRVDLPAKPLRQLLSPGSLVEIDVGGTPEWRMVDGVGNDSITLRSPLSSTHSMTAAITVASREFDLHIVDPRTGSTEDLTGLSMDPGHPKWWGRVTSAIVTLEPPPSPPGGTIVDPRPQVATETLGSGTDDDRATSWASLVALPDDALATLSPIDAVAIVAIPGATSKPAHQSIVTHCELMGDRVAILDSTRGNDSPTVVAEAADATGDNRGFAALYYPWIQIINTTTRLPELWPPSAHLAGVYARTDNERGVHKAPANTGRKNNGQ